MNDVSVEYLKGAEPLFIRGSKDGCLLLHGAGGGTSWDLKEFAHLLNARAGMTVWLPTLRGFGTRPEDLLSITFDDWLGSAREGLDKLGESCNRIFVVGHSVGGLLTIALASEHALGGIVMWAAPLSVRDRRLKLVPFLKRMPLLRRAIPERIPVPVPEEIRKLGWVGYDWIPSSVAMAVVDGMQRAKALLSQVDCPAFVVQGSSDTMVSEGSPKRIYEGMRSETRQIWIVEGADHPMMNQPEYKGELYDRTVSFLSALMK